MTESLTPILLHEKCLLGALIMAKSTRDGLNLLDAILPAGSITPMHAPAIEAIRAIAARGKEADLVAVAAELGARDELDRYGGANGVMAWVEGCPDPINGLEKYARSILEYRNRKQAQDLATVISNKIRKGEPLDKAADLDKLSGLLEAANADAAATKPPVDFQKQSGALLQKASDCLSHVEETIDYVLEPALTVGCLTQLHGEPKAGKSCVGLYLAICAATGMAPGGPGEMSVKQSVPVLFVTFEDGPRRLKRRIIDYMAGLGFADCYPPDFYVWFKPDINLGSPGGIACMMAALASTKAKLLVIDTISHVHRAEENDAGEMKQVMLNLAKIARDAACAALYLHHTAKSGDGKSDIYRGRGSGAIVAAADVVLNWGNPDNDVTRCSFTSKDDESRSWLFHYIRIPEGVRWEIHPQDVSKKAPKITKTDDNASDLLAVMKAIALQGYIQVSGRDLTKMMKDKGLSKQVVNRALHDLVEKNLISEIPQGIGKTIIYEVLKTAPTVP